MRDYLNGHIIRVKEYLDGLRPASRLNRDELISSLFRAKMTPDIEENERWSQVIGKKIRRVLETERYTARRHEGD